MVKLALNHILNKTNIYGSGGTRFLEAYVQLILMPTVIQLYKVQPIIYLRDKIILFNTNNNTIIPTYFLFLPN